MVKRKRPWYLLSSHGLVLAVVARFGDITVPEIAEKSGLSRSTVLNRLKELRAAHILRVRKRGRRNEYQVDSKANFRHPAMSDTEIDSLVRALRRSG